MKAKIMIVSHEPETARIWGFSLTQIGLDVKLSTPSDDVMETWANEPPDLMIIEDCGEKVDELELCSQLRTLTVVPILYLAAKNTETFLVQAYRAGADEVIPLPITPRLFQAKVKAWLRQTRNAPVDVFAPVEIGEFWLNPESRQLRTPMGEVVNLSVLETRLLYLLMRHPRRVFTTTQLDRPGLGIFWGSRWDHLEKPDLPSAPENRT